jgi:dynein heavy chain
MRKDIRFLDKSLSDYLDKKRSEFSRLYFTSNDELIQLMGNLKNIGYLQVFLGKLFEGIGGLVFDRE